MVAVARSFEAEPAAVSEARAVVRSLLEPTDEGLVALVVLLADEVVTNAVVHGEGPVDLAIDANEDRVKVMVRDRSDGRVSPRRAPQLSEGGRGLSIVQSIASRWGVSTARPGKTVWFEVDRAS
ncbi:MAG: ATP-binding protein [Acidimicrobiales bacterium]